MLTFETAQKRKQKERRKTQSPTLVSWNIVVFGYWKATNIFRIIHIQSGNPEYQIKENIFFSILLLCEWKMGAGEKKKTNKMISQVVGQVVYKWERVLLLKRLYWRRGIWSPINHNSSMSFEWCINICRRFSNPNTCRSSNGFNFQHSYV